MFRAAVSSTGRVSSNASASAMTSLHSFENGCPNHNFGLNPAVQPLLTDLYQISMTYAYWRSGKQNEAAVFDLFFRKNPFQGEFVVFAGLGDCIELLKEFRFSESDIKYLKSVLPPTTENEFFEYLFGLDCRDISLRAVPEGTVVFPRVPLITVEGPLAVCQLLETTLLNLVNYASLICTNAARFRLAAGDKVTLMEAGLRRAQGPDGAMSASRYSYMGGFDSTSNVLAGKIYDIPIRGTQAHSFVASFDSVEQLRDECQFLNSADDERKRVDCLALALRFVDELANKVLPGIVRQEISDGELRAFVAFAVSFPRGFLALIDTYDVLKSGVVNFCACALALNELGYRPVGVRIDSGDLAYLSKRVRHAFHLAAEHYDLPWFAKLCIAASNDINEETIYSLNDQFHEIDSFSIGTHLVTCQKQPALGCVYKLVELRNKPRIKLSQDVEKITIPGRKKAYRLYSKDGYAINDLMMLESEKPPDILQSVLCRHAFQESRRAFVTPSRVELLHVLYWEKGKPTRPILTVNKLKAVVQQSLKTIRDDHRRYLNPTPYKVSVSTVLYDFFHLYWLKNAPIGQLE